MHKHKKLQNYIRTTRIRRNSTTALSAEIKTGPVKTLYV